MFLHIKDKRWNLILVKKRANNSLLSSKVWPSVPSKLNSVGVLGSTVPSTVVLKSMVVAMLASKKRKLKSPVVLPLPSTINWYVPVSLRVRGSLSLLTLGEKSNRFWPAGLMNSTSILKSPLIPNFSQNLRSPNTEALQEVGLNRAIADFPNQQSVVRF